jgi:hypothetical protein
MVIAKRQILLLALTLLGVSSWIWYIDSSTPNHEPIAATSAAAAAKPVALIAPSSITSLDPLANLDPFASLALRSDLLALNRRANSVQTLRELQRGKTLAEAQVAAAMSDDPVVHVNSMHMMFPCMAESVQLARRDAFEYQQSLSLDPKTGAQLPVNPDEVVFTKLRTTSGPQRVYPPQEVRAEIAREASEPIEERVARLDRGERDYAKEMAIWRANSVAPNAPEHEAYRAARDRLVETCVGSVTENGFGFAYRNRRDKFATDGLIGALLFNYRAGWTSDSTLYALSDRDYALVERAILGQHADAMATLLLRYKLTPQLDVAALPDDAVVAWMAVTHEAQRLAACALNVADCSPNGFIFQESCLNFGGCDQPDAFALWRYVLARDGLDPTVIDRVVADLVAKIRAGDLEALRIRRKK